jgi:hypothetical protein
MARLGGSAKAGPCKPSIVYRLSWSALSCSTRVGHVKNSSLHPVSLSLFSLLIAFASLVEAQVYSPRAQELKFTLEASFVTGQDLETEDLIETHFRHLFGLLKSRKLIVEAGVDPNKIEGLGAPLMKPQIRVLADTNLSGGRRRISYRATAKALIVNELANRLLEKGEWLLPMPNELDSYYDKSCTDQHYDSQGDFWYFYDPYRKRCAQLLEAPLAAPARLRFAPGTKRPLDQSPRLDLLRGNNGNGSDFTIDIIHGFNESSKSRKDEGRENFEDVNLRLARMGFRETVERNHWERPLHRFEKEVVLANGKKIRVLIRHLLVNSSIEARGKTFANFFREAVETADVLIYSGHSGLGGNLDLGLLAQKSGEFTFNPAKRQIFYFESCSSYSYYLDPFRTQKTRSKLDILTNALASYFHTGPDVLVSFISTLVSPDTDHVGWKEIIDQMESPLRGGSYLLNVGGI